MADNDFQNRGEGALAICQAPTHHGCWAQLWSVLGLLGQLELVISSTGQHWPLLTEAAPTALSLSQTWTQTPNAPLLVTSPAPGRPRAALSPPPVIVLGLQLPIQDLALGLAQA